MHAEILCLSLLLFFSVFYAWAFKALPGERWQFFAVLPLSKQKDGSWKGLNFTYYGVFTALAGLVSIATFLMLTFSVGVDLVYTLIMTAITLAVCLPAARIVTILVEKKNHGFTIGGASFVGIILMPLILLGLDQFAQHYFDTALPAMPIMAAMIIAYILGEGVGRLACISFGCCHGKPVDQVKPPLQHIMHKCADVYEGETKKIAYASNLCKVPVVPIQSITTTLYTIVGIIGIYLFFKGLYATAFLLCLIFSQAWRILSELLRADFRGFNKITAYQWMAIIGCVYGVILFFWMPSHADLTPSVIQGLNGLWDMKVFIALQIFTLVMFLFSGTSTVSESNINIRIDLSKV